MLEDELTAEVERGIEDTPQAATEDALEDKPATAMTGVEESGQVTEGNSTGIQDEAKTDGALDIDAIEGTFVKVLEGATNKGIRHHS